MVATLHLLLPVGMNGVSGAVPVAVAPAQARTIPVPASVCAPAVAVKLVFPAFSHVTAPAAEDITANSDISAATSTAKRAILLMLFSYSYANGAASEGAAGQAGASR